MSIWDTWATDPRFSQVQADVRYAPATSNFKRTIHDILFNYGFGSGGAQDPTDQTIEANPYSVAARLKMSNFNQNQGTINDANAAGLGESGAAVGALNANSESYKQQIADAVAQEQAAVNQATGDYQGTVSGIFGDVVPTPAAPTGAVPAAPSLQAPGPAGVGGTTGVPQPQGGYTRTGPEAGGMVKKLKARVIGPPGGMGHIT